MYRAHQKKNPIGKIWYLWKRSKFFTKFAVFIEENSGHIFCKFHCNILLHSKIITIWTWMCIFQSEQVIKFRNALVSSKKWMTTEFARCQKIELSCVGPRCWDTVRNIRSKHPVLPSWRLPCYRYGMICHRSSLIRQSRHFKRDFDRVLLQLVAF